ncbi:hypothetical protein DLAC_08741 [Tieghemostelium lacteum]|uniref:Malonyl-CoA decarboxylase C-terminal domain-containing protein n=1 Tax=Tieghemostelium lacteum TaxID=361077 RepID=A0A151Z870_TIELA|nr:hypothetical protein DLAC_08741 [Tieghemostelium lacteum]|eukprot:KYQ90150.1 hypothetical protein DLAC_08741 [Tieghemostelium lacteum]
MLRILTTNHKSLHKGICTSTKLFNFKNYSSSNKGGNHMDQNYISEFFHNYNNIKTIENKKSSIESFVQKFKVGEGLNFSNIKKFIDDNINILGSLDAIETVLDIRSDLGDYASKQHSSTTTPLFSQELLTFESFLYDLIRDELKVDDLVCKPIDPNHINQHVLEQITSNEAVHPYSLDKTKRVQEIQQRMNGNDRLCLVLFHKDIPNLPLMSLYIALTVGIPGKMSTITNEISSTQSPNSAIFYSISSLHRGLKNVNFGHILIKKAMKYLQSTYSSKIINYCTLSPIPNFKNHLKRKSASDDTSKNLLAIPNDEEILEANKNQLLRLCLDYLYNEKKKGNKSIDPVSNFHLKNGASIYRLNWKGDLSPHRFDESFGIMINYYYNPDKISTNSSMYKSNGFICTEELFENQLKNKELNVVSK